MKVNIETQTVTVEVPCTLMADGKPPVFTLIMRIVDGRTSAKQDAAVTSEQNKKEHMQPPQERHGGFQSGKQRYGNKAGKMVTPKQIEWMNNLAEERHFSIQQICDKYNVSDISQLNQAQAQEVFDRNKKNVNPSQSNSEDLF